MRRRLALASAAVIGLGAGTVLTGGVAAPAWADDEDCVNVRADDTGLSDTELSSPPYAQLDIGQAQKVVKRYAPQHERPVRVAVLDSGVYGAVGANDQLTVHARTTVTGSSELTDYHGTAVAGLIAGHPRPSGKPVGFAPDAEIVDVRVYDVQDSSNEDGKEVSGSALVEGLNWVAQHAHAMNIRVANVSLVVRKTGQLTSAIKKVRKAGVVVVASSGNRPPDQSSEFYDDFATTEELDTDKFRSEDGAGILYPASYRDVITVNSTADGADGDLASYVVKNSRTDVAVPTNGAVTYGINGKTCFLQPPATSWAAAEVSGVLALLWQRFPHDTDEQIIARLLTTANGTMDDPTPYTGVGVVQPYEALTRPLGPAGTDQGQQMTTQQDVEVRATAPEPKPDLLAGPRDDAVWWGLIGGGTLVVALLLRPVLSRRRP